MVYTYFSKSKDTREMPLHNLNPIPENLKDMDLLHFVLNDKLDYALSCIPEHELDR